MKDCKFSRIKSFISVSLLLLLINLSTATFSFAGPLCIKKGSKLVPGTIKKNKLVTYTSLKDSKNHSRYSKYCSSKPTESSFDAKILFDQVQGVEATDSVCNQTLQGIVPQFFLMPFGRDMTFGSKGSEKKVTASDFRFDSNYNATSGEGADKKGKFVGLLNINSHSNSCQNSSNTVSNLFSIIRQNQSSKLLEVYGSYAISSGDVVKCTGYFKNQTTLSALWCTKNGKPVVVSSHSSCLSTPPDSYQYPSFLKGHWGFTDSSALHYECINPLPQTDEKVGAIISPKCTNLTDTGFNTSAINTTHTINGSDNSILETQLNSLQIRNMATILLRKGIAPMLIPDFIVNVNGQTQDGYEVFTSLTNDATFQAKLKTLVLDYASLANKLKIPYFAPVMEMDKMHGGYAAASSWSQEMLPQIKERYSGKVLWIAGSPDIDVNTDVRGYDIFGFNTSPLDNHTAETYQTWVTQGSSRLAQICSAQEIPQCLITASGIWGTTLSTSYWSTNYSKVFQISTQLTDTHGFKGLTIFDGKNNGGELSLSQYSDVRTSLASYYGSK